MRVETARKLPPVSSDRAKVKQIVLNLVTNAIKFTPQRVGHRRRRATTPRPRRSTIAVTDTGIGIRPRTTSASSRTSGRPTTRRRASTAAPGLGLAICRRLAHMLEGRVELQSAVGQGSTFTLTLPVRLRRR